MNEAAVLPVDARARSESLPQNTTRAEVGRSLLDDSADAGREAASRARAALEGRTPRLALVFASADHEQDELIASVRATVPGVKVVGCSGEGIIAGSESSEAMSGPRRRRHHGTRRGEEGQSPRVHQNLCRLMGGTVDDASTPGVGSVFHVMIPAVLEQSLAVQAA